LRGDEFDGWRCALGHDLMSIDDIPEPCDPCRDPCRDVDEDEEAGAPILPGMVTNARWAASALRALDAEVEELRKDRNRIDALAHFIGCCNSVSFTRASGGDVLPQIGEFPMHPGPLRAVLECMRQAAVLLTEEGGTGG